MTEDWLPVPSGRPPRSLGVLIRGAIVGAMAVGIGAAANWTMGLAIAGVAAALVAWRWVVAHRLEVASRSVNPEEYQRVRCDVCHGVGQSRGRMFAGPGCWKCLGAGWVYVRKPREDYAPLPVWQAPAELQPADRATQAPATEPSVDRPHSDETPIVPSAPTAPTPPTPL